MGYSEELLFFVKFILGKHFQHLDIGWLILAHGDHLIQEDKLATFEVRFCVFRLGAFRFVAFLRRWKRSSRFMGNTWGSR